jgi:ADP-heptose:LPS heptosyltransferase
MTTVIENLPEHGRVLLVRLRSLGDCVLTTPAIALLRQARPDLRLAVAVEERFRAVFEGNPDIEEILPPDMGAAWRWRPELAVNLHGGTRSLLLTLASQARWRAGYGHYRHQWAYTVRIPRAQQVLGEERLVHTAEHVASAMFYLGVTRCEIPRARLYASRPAEEHPYAVIHPMASAAEKTWPAERFLEVARVIGSTWGLEPIFIGGPREDLGAFRTYRRMAGRPLSEVKALLAGASLFVGNDSGPAHIAAAFGVPVVVLYGPSDPVVWAPWRTLSEVVTARGPLAEVPAAAVLERLERLKVRV